MAALSLPASLTRVAPQRFYGRVLAVQGLMVEIGGIAPLVASGSRLALVARGGRRVPWEVVGFRDGRAVALPFGTLDGVGIGCRARLGASEPGISTHPSWARARLQRAARG